MNTVHTIPDPSQIPLNLDMRGPVTCISTEAARALAEQYQMDCYYVVSNSTAYFYYEKEPTA